MNNKAAWKATLGELEMQMPKATFHRNLMGSRLVSVNGSTAVIAVSTDFAKQWLDNRLMETVRRTFSTIIERDLDVEFVVDSNEEGEEVSPPDSKDNDRPPEPDRDWETQY